MSSFAMIPFLGMTAPGQRAYKAITGAAGRKIGLRFSVDAAGVVHFSYRGQLARVIGKVAGHQAHHIIPWSENFHPIVQLAARYGWHPNDFINGISVLNARHGSHPAYTAAIRAKLGEISAKVGNSGAQAVIELETLAVNVSNIIRNNTIPINDPQIINLINNIPI